MTEYIGLKSHRVTEVFMDCLFSDPPKGKISVIKAPGLVRNVGFDPNKVNLHRAEINAMLDELPNDFKESGGRGMSFLNACFDRHGVKWTGLHQTVEQLVQLGLATGKLGYCLQDRALWRALPGGVPYIVVFTTPKEVKVEEIENA